MQTTKGWITIFLSCLMLTITTARAADRQFISSSSPAENCSSDSRDSDLLPAFLTALDEGFDARLRAISAGSVQTVAASSQNPGNDFLTLPKSRFQAELRPDLFLDFSRADFFVKPRFFIDSKRIETHSQGGFHEDETKIYINEWLARFCVNDELHLSLGRENLQWGPGFLASPSNPFFMDNGRRTPREEVRGKDFARAVWSISDGLSTSAIANYGNGSSLDDEEFNTIMAIKLDLIKDTWYTSLIFSHEENDRNRVAAFGGWVASDALILYSEALLQQGSESLYPVDSTNEFGSTLAPSKSGNNAMDGALLAGASYTLLAGPTLTVEYLFHSLGYTDTEAKGYYTLRDLAGDAYSQGGPSAESAAEILSMTADPGLRFLRRNYLMIQLYQTGIKDVWDISGRWVFNLDDSSSQGYGSISRFIGDHVELFITATINAGSSSSEFGTFYDHQVTLGMEITF